MTYTVLLIDDQPAILTGMTAVVEATGLARVVATASNGADAVAHARQHQPDLIFLDVSLGSESGIDVAASLLAQRATNRILAMSAHTDSVYVRGMLNAGACGYLLKEKVHDEIHSAITTVMSERQWIGDGLEL